jgi:Protein of unknown function (DUF3606)
LNLRQGKIAMQRVKHPPVRNKIDLTDSNQVRAWTRRLAITAKEIEAIVSKVGDSVAAVTKEIELQRSGHKPLVHTATRKADCQPA